MCLDHFLDDFVGEPVNRFEVSRQLGWIREAAGALERTFEHLLDIITLLSTHLGGVIMLPMLFRNMFVKYVGMFLS